MRGGARGPTLTLTPNPTPSPTPPLILTPNHVPRPNPNPDPNPSPDPDPDPNPTQVAIEAHWRDAKGVVLGPALAPGASAFAAAAPTELRLTARPARATHLLFAAHNEDGWKERTVLWEVEGLASDAWELDGDTIT